MKKQSLDSQMVKGHMDLLVLGLLQSRGAMHGYRIRKELTDLSGRVFQPSYGRLYPHLAEMSKNGWLKSRTELVGERRERKTYSITAKGETELKRRIEKWSLFSKGIEEVLKHCRF